MSIALLILLGAAAGFAIDGLFSNDDDDDGREGFRLGGDGVERGDGAEGGSEDVVRVDTGLISEGTDGDDTYVYDPEATGSVMADIDAGAGDDIINLASLFDAQSLNFSSLEGGTGNDQIIAEGEQNVISGGDGDDTISVVGFDNTISGGAGNDDIRAINGASDPTEVDGGTGNDTIDISGSENVIAVGGEGDDVLISSGRTIDGTGYVIASDGGDGDDTLNHSVDVFPLPLQDPSESAALLTGGNGADTFNILLTTGDGAFTADEGDPDVFVNEAAIITDFQQGIDILSVDIPSDLIGYAAETATLTEDAVAGTTTFSFELNDDDLPTQAVNIIVNATGLSWSDVTFTDQSPTALNVA